MKAARVASHLACLAAGAFFVASWRPAFSSESSAPSGNGDSAGAHELSAKTAARAAQAATHPRELLKCAAHMPMESGHRETLKEQLLKEWGERDPQDLLAWLKDRPWNPGGGWSGFGVRRAVLESFARKDPEGLLRYAREVGCSTALSAWVENGLPAETLRRITSGEVGSLPDWVIDEIFEYGCGIDPHFHKQLRSVAEGPARSDAAVTIANSFLDNCRFEEFFEWIGRDGDLVPMQEVGECLGKALVDSKIDPAFFAKLPDAAKAGAADGFFQSLTASSAAEPEQLLNLLTLFQSNDLLEQRSEAASRAIESSASGVIERSSFGRGVDGDPAEISETNRSGALSLIQWADTLPAGAEFSHLRTTAWKGAIAIDPAATQAGIDGIADAKLRDFCHAWAAFHLEDATAAQASVRKIVDVDARAQLQRYREWKEDTTREPDPFGYDGPLPWNE